MRFFFLVSTFFAAIAVVQSTGHIKLTMSANAPCDIQVSSPEQNFNVSLATVVERSIRIQVRQRKCRKNFLSVIVGMQGLPLKDILTFPLVRNQTRDNVVLKLDDCTVIIRGSFECDRGFTGWKCENRSRCNGRFTNKQPEVSTTPTSTTHPHFEVTGTNPTTMPSAVSMEIPKNKNESNVVVYFPRDKILPSMTTTIIPTVTLAPPKNTTVTPEDDGLKGILFAMWTFFHLLSAILLIVNFSCCR